ncbi:MAG TPA: hypothetical protein VFP43_18805, partial [Mesorhizobium sp.]|nr:hypothetical protein [Mesorhizobium sp.]
MRRAGHDADDGVDREGEEHEQVAEDFVGNADLLENCEKNHESDKAARIGAVHSAELFIEGIGC